MFHFIHPQHWTDYELLDCGNFEKLERFGNYILIRPEPQAVWKPKWSREEWMDKAHALYSRENPAQSVSNKEGRGSWKMLKKMPEHWVISYDLHGTPIKFKLSLTAFGHVGVFPEQADNWEFIFQKCSTIKECNVLNLFAYTGGASMAAAATGAMVTHLDSVRQTISWTNENKELSKLKEMRWVVEDAMKFVKREGKRGNYYNGIILDPPAYGRGPKGEKWLLEHHLNDIIEYIKAILDPKQGFVVMNLYSLGMSALTVENIMKHHFPKASLEFGENYIPSLSGLKLPLGIYVRFSIK